MIVIILKKWSVELFLYKHEIEQLSSLEIELRTRWDLSTSHPPSLYFLCTEKLAMLSVNSSDIGSCLERDHWVPRQEQAYLPSAYSLFPGPWAGQPSGRCSVLQQWKVTSGSRWEPNMLCSWRLAWLCLLAFPLWLLPRSPAPAPQPCFCSPGGTSDSFWPETPPLNKRAAGTLGELMLGLSSPFYSLLPWWFAAARPARLGNVPPTTETKFGLRKKKRRRRRRKLSQAYLCTVCSCDVLFPSFTEGKSGKSPEEEIQNAASPWVGHIKMYLLPALDSCQRSCTKECVPSGSESEGLGGMWLAAGNGNHVYISPLPSAS